MWLAVRPAGSKTAPPVQYRALNEDKKGHKIPTPVVCFIYLPPPGPSLPPHAHTYKRPCKPTRMMMNFTGRVSQSTSRLVSLPHMQRSEERSVFQMFWQSWAFGVCGSAV